MKLSLILTLLKGCSIAIFGLFIARLRDPIVDNETFNTHIDWFDLLLVIEFAIIYYFFLNKSRLAKN
jgi:hypothetical protein